MKRWIIRRVIDRIGIANIICAAASWSLFVAAMTCIWLERGDATYAVIMLGAAMVLAVFSQL